MSKYNIHLGMSFLKRIILNLCFFFCLNAVVNAQDSFAISSDSVQAIRPSNTFVFYNFTNFQNLTTDTLRMMWVKKYLLPDNETDPGGFGQWGFNIQDPRSTHEDAVNKDSVRFFLSPIQSNTDKFILQLFPNGEEGELNAQYKFFNLENPSDSSIVTFYFSVNDELTSTQSFASLPQINISPNPFIEQVTIQNLKAINWRLGIYNSRGVPIHDRTIKGSDAIVLDASEWTSGMYYFVFQSKEELVVLQLIKL